MKTRLLALLSLYIFHFPLFIGASGAPPGPVVEMEPYVVKGDRVLPEPERWTYVRVPALALERGGRTVIAPGYELLSNLNSSQTRVLVHELQLRQLASTRLWPALVRNLPRTPVYVVVDINQQHSAPRQFVKTSDTWEGDPIVAVNIEPAPSNFSSSVNFAYMGAQRFASEYGLTQMDDMNDGNILTGDETETTTQDHLNLTSRNVPGFVRDESIVRPLPDGYVELAVNGGPLAVLVRADEPRSGLQRPSVERLASTVSYELGRFALDAQPQKLPAWFTRGFSNLLGSTQVSDRLIQFARVREELAGRTMPKLSELLKKEGAFTEEEARAASLFVHYGLYGDNNKYSARFMQFVNRLASGVAPTDAMFREVFGKSMKTIENHLAAYARDIAYYKSTDFKFDSPPPLPAPTYRAATQSEVARIKGEMHVSQANPGKALEELRTAYWRGERDPAMLALLATLEQQAGSEARARKILKTLMALPKPPAQAHIAAARLQLKDALAAKPAGAKLNAEETSALIDTLGGALTGGLATEDVCDTLAEILLKSEARPEPGTLGFLQQAAKRFPKNQTIAGAAGIKA
ncbi:hypothetical protein M2447_001703 [Ereboglobus sp. PH5-10]|uniref:hypothetical protein n=1 Tax=Ereboglobus sp. PH5-10 TaxID=2940629 RepID=UPI0024061B44|nr:hypothetical protein [Ereboglobus sp. PH5-10]MDF9827605.1 hypothetical protein [Ereboglobus sp. PH5-10]